MEGVVSKLANIVILYDGKAREMDTDMLLLYELSRRGHKVDLFQLRELNRRKFFFNTPDLVITPFLYGDYELNKFIYKTFGHVKKICNLQWEQVYIGSSKKESKSTPKQEATKAVHICWGQESYERLKRNGCSHAVLTGAPHLDFLKSKFATWHKSRQELFSYYNIDSSKKTLLFISSFSYLSIDDKILEGIRHLTDVDPIFFKELTIASRNIILEWFDKFLTDREEDVNVIYRPHPGELIDDKLSNLCEKHKSLYYISDYSVQQWITVSDIILNWYSTSVVDAFFANKSNLFLRPIEIPAEIEYEIFQNICKCKTYEDFLSFIDMPQLVDEYYKKFLLEKSINTYYLVEDSYSYLKIVDLVERMLTTQDFDLKDDGLYSSYSHFTTHLDYAFKYLTYVVLKNTGLKKFKDYKKMYDVNEEISAQERTECINRLKKLPL